TYTITLQDDTGTDLAEYSLTQVTTPGTHQLEAGEGALTSGVTTSGSLAAGDIDVYTFEANTGDSTVLSFATTQQPSSNFSARMRVTGPTGLELYDAFSDDHSFKLPNLAAGTYTITLQDNTGAYLAD